MFAHAKMFALAGATAIAMPALANAAVINLMADTPYTFVDLISPGETVEFQFKAQEDLMVTGFVLAATGTSASADIGQIRFGLVNPPGHPFTTFQNVGLTAAGFGFIPGDTWDKDSLFSFYVSDGIVNDVGLTLSFTTASVATIPLPATGLLLAPFLLAGGIAGLRRRKAGSAAV